MYGNELATNLLSRVDASGDASKGLWLFPADKVAFGLVYNHGHARTWSVGREEPDLVSRSSLSRTSVVGFRPGGGRQVLWETEVDWFDVRWSGF